MVGICNTRSCLLLVTKIQIKYCSASNKHNYFTKSNITLSNTYILLAIHHILEHNKSD